MSEEKENPNLITEESKEPIIEKTPEQDSNIRETRTTIPIHQPNYDYLEQIQITDYFFLIHKNMPYIFYTFLVFAFALLICSIIFLGYKSIVVFIILSIGFILIGGFPYGIYVKLRKEDKSLLMEKKCMIPLFSRFVNEKYNLFDIQEFILMKKEIDENISGLKINLILMNGKQINIYDEWVLKEDKSEFVEKTKKLNEFINKI